MNLEMLTTLFGIITNLWLFWSWYTAHRRAEILVDRCARQQAEIDLQRAELHRLNNRLREAVIFTSTNT